jgi:hypothetical protein
MPTGIEVNIEGQQESEKAYLSGTTLPSGSVKIKSNVYFSDRRTYIKIK